MFLTRSACKKSKLAISFFCYTLSPSCAKIQEKKYSILANLLNFATLYHTNQLFYADGTTSWLMKNTASHHLWHHIMIYSWSISIFDFICSFQSNFHCFWPELKPVNILTQNVSANYQFQKLAVTAWNFKLASSDWLLR